LNNEENNNEIASVDKKPTVCSQQMFFNVQTVELKLDIDFELETKSVVAMCLSKVTANVKNWSKQVNKNPNKHY